MTLEDRVIELMKQANPVPNRNDTPLPQGAGAYLRRLEQRSNTVKLSAVDPDTTEHHDPHDRRKPLLLVAVAAAVAALIAGFVVVGTRSDDEPVPADQPTSPTQTGDPAPDGESAPPPSEPDPTLPAPSEVTPERLSTGKILDGGTTYRTSADPARGMTPAMDLTIPSDHGEKSWSVLNAFPLEVDFLPLGDWVRSGVREPTFGLAPVTEGVSVDDVVATVEAYAADDPDFELSVDRGRIRGETVTMLRGTSSRGPGVGANLRVPTSSNSRFSVPPSREFVVYLIEGPTHVVAAKIESSAADFDAAVERVVPILDTIEFP